MHFVYKTDNLFRSIRFSYENTYITMGFHFLNSILSMSSKCTIQSHIIIFNTFSLHLLFFMDLLIFLHYMTLKTKSSTNELSKGLKLAWNDHFTRIASAKKLRGSPQKLDALRVQTGQSLSKYQGFTRKLICYTGNSKC